MAKVGTELLAERERESEGMISAAEVVRMLEFAEWFLTSAGSVWEESSIENKLRIQYAAVLASPGGFEPPLPP